MGGFVYDGIHSSSFDLIVTKVTRSLLPPIRENTETVPGRPGVFDFGMEFDARKISVTCYLKTGSDATLWQRARAIAEWLNPYKGVKDLYFDDEPGKVYRARVSGDLDLEQLMARLGQFSLEFTCPDPFAYAASDDHVEISSVGAHEFTRQGTANSRPLIRIYGTISGNGVDAIVATFNNSDTVRYVGQLNASSYIEIDCDAFTVVRVSGSTRTNALSGLYSLVFPELLPGLNTVNISTIGDAQFTRLDIQCRSRWL